MREREGKRVRVPLSGDRERKIKRGRRRYPMRERGTREVQIDWLGMFLQV